MPEGRRITDRRSLSGSLDVTAGSGIWDSEGGATYAIIHMGGGKNVFIVASTFFLPVMSIERRIVSHRYPGVSGFPLRLLIFHETDLTR